MKANLIKTLKNNAELVDIEAGRSARANFPGVDFENAVLIINGKIATPDTIIQEGDVVTLRQVPGDLTDTPWWVATFIIPFGFIIQPIELGIQAREKAEDAEKELEKIKKLTNSESVDNRPFLRGATNTIATGKSQPYFCGRNFLTPYLFTPPYYKISGTDGDTQEVYNILEAGFNAIVINKLGLGDTNIKTFSESTPQNGVYTINDGIFAKGVIEIRQDGEPFSTLTELNAKVESKVIRREIVKEYQVTAGDEEYTTFSINPNAETIEVCINFPYGLYKYNSNNDRAEATVTITPEYSLDGGSTWTQFTFNQNGTPSNVFTRNVVKELRYVAKHTFTLADYTALFKKNQTNIIIRVRSDAPDDQKTRANSYVYYYQSKIFDPLKSSKPAGVLNDSGAAGLVSCLNVENREREYACIIGVKLEATKNNEDKQGQINIIATSTARTWNGEEWSESKSPTRNPAAIALEILTSDTHPASRYADSEIDLDAFGALYKYCAYNDIRYDRLIMQNQKKDAELQKIANVCGCAFYTDIYGRRSVAIDQAQENAVAVYNPQNIISLTNKKTFARRVDALRIKYVDSTNDTYKENTYTVTRLENGQPVTIDENSIIKEIDAPGITRQPQIVKYARRLMAIDELRPVTTTLKIGAEGVYFTPYAKINIQDPSINRDAQDAIIKSVTYNNGLLTTIIIDRKITIESGKNYGIVINAVDENSSHSLPLRVTGSGTTDTLTVLDIHTIGAPIQPSAGNVATFGELGEQDEFGSIVHEYIITRVARSDGGFTLDLQEYNEAIYNPGTIPAYKPIINNTPTPAAGNIPPDSVTHEELDEAVAGANGDAVQAAVDTIQNGYRFTNIYNVRPITDTLEEIVARMDDDAKNQSASISITEEEILLQVSDMERALIGLIDIQAGSVMALVEGGGATGQMALSINLPVMITSAQRTAFINASTADKVNAVYALVAGTTYYSIKGNASSIAIKALWDDALAAGLLASQIVLSADQIKIAGKTIYTSAKTDAVSAADAAAAQSNAISAAATDATNKANAAQSAAISAAASDATAKANAAQSAAETYADSAASDAQTAAENTAAADATTKANNALADAKDYADDAAADAQSAAENTAETKRQALITALSQDATAGHTVIDGGYLKTVLIDVENILTKTIAVKDKGIITSANYNGTIDADGNITAHGTAGWAIDNAGNSDFASMHAYGDLTATDLQIVCRSGNIPFRNLYNGVYEYSDQPPRSIYSQIVATGTVNVHVWTKAQTITAGDDGNIQIYHVTTGGVETLVKRIDLTTLQPIHGSNYYVDVDINVGESIKVYLDGHNGGAVHVSNAYDVTIDLCSDAPQTILAYLGAIRSETFPSPAR